VDSVGALLPFVLILVAFYALIIRPARNRARAQQRLVEQLDVGVKVMTTSGLHGEIVGLEDDVVLLEAAPGVVLRFSKPAVARVLAEPEPEPDTEADADSATDDVADETVDPESTERQP
jgi:preprotein translocase subunit YajC